MYEWLRHQFSEKMAFQRSSKKVINNKETSPPKPEVDGSESSLIWSSSLLSSTLRSNKGGLRFRVVVLDNVVSLERCNVVSILSLAKSPQMPTDADVDDEEEPSTPKAPLDVDAWSTEAVSDEVTVAEGLDFLFLHIRPFPTLFLAGTGDGNLGAFCTVSGSSFCSKNSLRTIWK